MFISPSLFSLCAAVNDNAKYIIYIYYYVFIQLQIRLKSKKKRFNKIQYLYFFLNLKILQYIDSINLKLKIYGKDVMFARSDVLVFTFFHQLRTKIYETFSYFFVHKENKYWRKLKIGRELYLICKQRNNRQKTAVNR